MKTGISNQYEKTAEAINNQLGSPRGMRYVAKSGSILHAGYPCS